MKKVNQCINVSNNLYNIIDNILNKLEGICEKDIKDHKNLSELELNAHNSNKYNNENNENKYNNEIINYFENNKFNFNNDNQSSLDQPSNISLLFTIILIIYII